MENKHTDSKWFRSRQLTRLRILLFVIVFAVIGVAYLVASHALNGYYSTTGGIIIMAHDINGKPLDNVTVTLPAQQSMVLSQGLMITSGFTCTPDQVSTYPYNNLPSYALTGCTVYNSTNSLVKIGTITDPGYSVASSSAYQDGSYITLNPNLNTPTIVSITMVINAPSPPPSPPSSPSPPSTPSQPASPVNTPPSTSSSSSHGSSSTGKSGKSSGSSSSSSTGGTPTTPGSNDSSSSTTNPAGSDNSDSLDSGSSNDDSSSTTPNVPQGSSAKLSSSDGLVSLTVPSGTFSTDAYCSIDGGSAKNLPSGSANAVGPYSLDCTDSNGNALSPSKPVSVAITLPPGKSNYVAYVDSTSWQKTTSTNNQKTIKFNLVKAQQFAAIQSKSRSTGVIILNIVGGLVLLLVLGFGIFLLRRHQQTDKYVDYDNYINHNQPTPPPLQ